jgi:L-rhamnose isomerase
LAYEANRQLKVFEKELLDVYHDIPEDFRVQLDSFNRFIDVFFDNLITDWIIQQKIYNALNNTLGIRDKVVRMLKTLETEVPKVNKVIEDLELQKKEYVLSVQ